MTAEAEDTDLREQVTKVTKAAARSIKTSDNLSRALCVISALLNIAAIQQVSAARTEFRAELNNVKDVQIKGIADAQTQMRLDIEHRPTSDHVEVRLKEIVDSEHATQTDFIHELAAIRDDMAKIREESSSRVLMLERDIASVREGQATTAERMKATLEMVDRLLDRKP